MLDMLMAMLMLDMLIAMLILPFMELMLIAMLIAMLIEPFIELMLMLDMPMLLIPMLDMPMLDIPMLLMPIEYGSSIRGRTSSAKATGSRDDSLRSIDRVRSTSMPASWAMERSSSSSSYQSFIPSRHFSDWVRICVRRTFHGLWWPTKWIMRLSTAGELRGQMVASCLCTT